MIVSIMKTDSNPAQRRTKPLREVMLEQMLQAAELFEDHPEVVSVDYCVTTVDNSVTNVYDLLRKRSYRMMLNLPEKEITVKQPVTYGEENDDDDPCDTAIGY